MQVCYYCGVLFVCYINIYPQYILLIFCHIKEQNNNSSQQYYSHKNESSNPTNDKKNPHERKTIIKIFTSIHFYDSHNILLLPATMYRTNTMFLLFELQNYILHSLHLLISKNQYVC